MTECSKQRGESIARCACAALALLAGCKSTVIVAGTGVDCDPQNLLGDVCIGVPGNPAAASCAALGPCQGVLAVDGPAGAGVIAGAKPGACVALGAGDYAAITLPPGVRLLGAGVDAVRVNGVTTTGGASCVAGLTTTGTIAVKAGATTIDAVRVLIAGAKTAGVDITADASATVTRSEIVSAGKYGVKAIGAAALSVRQTIVRDSSAGIWASCGASCCQAPAAVTLRDSRLDGNALLGLALVGVKAVVDNVQITHTQVGADFAGGGGMVVGTCSDVTASRVIIADSADFGLLVDDATARLSGVTIARNLRGAWFQNIGKSQPNASLSLTNSELTDNQGVGLGIARASKRVELSGLTIANTTTIALPTLVNGEAGMTPIGVGLEWSDVSQAKLDGVAFAHNGCAGLIIEGNVAAPSSVAHVTLSGGDETNGIVQQDIGTPPVSPSVLAGAPPISASAKQICPVSASGGS